MIAAMDSVATYRDIISSGINLLISSQNYFFVEGWEQTGVSLPNKRRV
jgi:hypothetical protein